MSDRPDDLSTRRAVWSALSDMYLDSSYRDQVRPVARELASTPYAATELRAILFDEVHPALAANRCASVGVWDRFDPTWLAARILANRRRPRWLRARGRCQRRYAVLLWRLLEPRIARLRAAAAPSSFAHSGN